MELFKILGRVAVDGVAEAKKDMTSTSEHGKKVASALSNVCSTIGKAVVGAAKVSAAAIGTTTAALAGLTKKAVEQYADYEQLTGGVETLFKESSEQVLEYSRIAFQTAGLSANEYMETVTSFSASLIQSLGGDTQKAAELGNQAILDMSDNANKMGSSMESIQNAYQGFAKQNYTMLDNLKLGYGGTASEMYRLLQEAAKLDEEFANNAVFSIDQTGHLEAGYADIVRAIHIVQTEMGITGTTAEEASSTISGSIATMKASWSNFLTSLGDENANVDLFVYNFAQSVSTVVKNLAPRIAQIVPSLVEGLSTIASELAPYVPVLIKSLLPALVSGAKTLLTEIGKNLPDILETIFPGIGAEIGETFSGIIGSVVKVFKSLAPMVKQFAVKVLPILLNIVQKLAPIFEQLAIQLLPAIFDVIEQLLPFIGQLLPIISEIVSAVLPVIVELIQQLLPVVTEILGLLFPIIEEILPPLLSLLEPIMSIISPIIEVLMKLLKPLIQLVEIILPPLVKIFSLLIDRVLKILVPIFDTIANIISDVFNVALSSIMPIVEGIMSAFSTAVDFIMGVTEPLVQFFGKIWSGIKNAFGSVADWFKNIFTKAWEGVKNVFSAGGKIFSGIKDGIANVFKTVVNKIIQGINKVISIPFNGINKMLEKIKGISIFGMKPFDWVSTFNVPQIPELAQGGVLKKGQVGFLEGDGDEAVVPLSQNTEWIDKVASQINGNISNDAVVKKLDELISSIKSLKIYLDTGAMVGGLTPALDTSLGQLYSARERGR